MRSTTTRRQLLRVAACAGALACAPVPALPGGDGARWYGIGRDRLRVTTGEIAERAPGRLAIDHPEVRAVVPGSSGDIAALRFAYLGPTAEVKALASGELRRQIGLKLRAEDTCNLLYVMWRIEPKGGVVVQAKRNPGASDHRECGPKGYRTLRPTRWRHVPPAAPGSRHVLEARVEAGALRVLADGEVAWEGSLPDDVLSLGGPAGVRSDNGRFLLELSVDPAGGRSMQPVMQPVTQPGAAHEPPREER